MLRQFDLSFDGKRIVEAKFPSLDGYDRDGLDGEDADILLGLTRWGDRKMRVKDPELFTSDLWA